MGGNSDALVRRKLAALSNAESTLHCIEMLGCLFSAASAVAHGEAVLVAWSVSALLSSALALYLLHHQRELYMSTSLRDWLYAGMRIHRACAIVGVRRAMRPPKLSLPPAWGPGGAAGDRVYFAKAVLVNSSILPILLQALVLQLPLPLQAAVQVAVASIVVRDMPDYCRSLATDGVQQSQFAWLARLQGSLASIVMAATSSSRSNISYEDVSCTVSLSHLVVVFEVIVPILFVFFFDRAAAMWFGGGEEAAQGGASSGGASSPGAGSPTRRLAATWPPTGAGDSAADGVRGGGAQQPHQQQRGRQDGHPPAILVLLFGLGLAGVLFDVALTYTSHQAR